MFYLRYIRLVDPTPTLSVYGEGVLRFDIAVTVPPLPAGEVAQRAGGGQKKANHISHPAEEAE